jgi:hypothetical protein
VESQILPQFARHYKGQPLNTCFISASDSNIIIEYLFQKKVKKNAMLDLVLMNLKKEKAL